MLPLVPRGITGNIWLMSSHNNIQIPPIGWRLPVKSFRVRSRASNACLLVIGASSTAIALASWMTLQSTVPLLIPYLFHCPYKFKVSIVALKFIPYFTGSSEKV